MGMGEVVNLAFWNETPLTVTTAPRRKAKPKGKPKYSEEFERDVWGPYPRKEGTSKSNAFRKFEGLDDEDRAAVIATIPAYTRMKAGSEQQYIQHLEFFISRRTFETITPTKTAPTAGPAPGIDWPRVLSLYARTGNWNVAFGAPPGSPGCLVPKEFLK